MKTKLLFLISLLIAFAFFTALFLGSFVFLQKSNIKNSTDSGNVNLELTPIEVAKHNKLSDCWMIIENKVYDITPYTNSHPGGNIELEKGCGIDATLLYNTKDKIGNNHSREARAILDKYYIGNLNKLKSTKLTVTPVTNPSLTSSSSPTITSQKITLTLDEIKKHNKLADCWMLIGTKVYDITPYTNSHPGGNSELEKGCGIDATRLYDTKDNQGSHSSSARTMLEKYYIGDLNQEFSSTELQTKTSTIQNSTPPSRRGEFEDD